MRYGDFVPSVSRIKQGTFWPSVGRRTPTKNLAECRA
jgi:hypothetical protein